MEITKDEQISFIFSLVESWFAFPDGATGCENRQRHKCKEDEKKQKKKCHYFWRDANGKRDEEREKKKEREEEREQEEQRHREALRKREKLRKKRKHREREPGEREKQR